jgi:hypothetical protein
MWQSMRLDADVRGAQERARAMYARRSHEQWPGARFWKAREARLAFGLACVPPGS